MLKKGIILIICVIAYFGSKAQPSNMLIARNAVGKLQEAISLEKSDQDQLKIINEGLQAVDLAKDDKRTKKWPETWAIKAYLSSYITILETDTAKSLPFIATTLSSIDTSKMLDKLLENAKLLEAASYNVNLKMQGLGNDYYSTENYDKAFGYLSKVSDYFPSDTTAAVNAALTALKIKNQKEAKRFFLRALDNKAKSPAIYLNLAQIYDLDAHAEDALSIVKQGLKMNPNHNELIAKQLNLLINNGMQEEALPVLKTAIKINPQAKLLHYLQGYIYQKNKQYAAAIDSYQKAINIDRYYFEPIYQLSLLYIDQANALAQEATHNETVKSNYLQLMDQAILKMQSANEIEPDNKNTLEILIQLYGQLRQTDKSLEYKNRLEGLN